MEPIISVDDDEHGIYKSNEYIKVYMLFYILFNAM
jgi:hypothetical protein